MFPYQLSDEKPAKTIQFLVKQPNFWAYFGAKMTLMTFLIRNERVIKYVYNNQQQRSSDCEEKEWFPEGKKVLRGTKARWISRYVRSISMRVELQDPKLDVKCSTA